MSGVENLPNVPASGVGVVVPLQIPLRALTIDDLETFYLTCQVVVFFITAYFLKGKRISMTINPLSINPGAYLHIFM